MSGSNGLRPGVRFRRIELDYGRHSGSFDLESSGRPLVIEGPNGTGKSSLVEGIVRTLFGFRRGRRDERAAYELRRPWADGPYRGRVTLATPKGEWAIERDFDTDLVTITESGHGSPLFEGEANPTRAGETARRYRALLGDAIGLSDLDHYLRTACVFQGGLGGTKLSLDLLRVVAGGHTDVESAQARLRKEYSVLTLEPIAEGVARRRKTGVVEDLEREASDLESLARAARVAEEKRGPLVRAREERRAMLDAIDAELAGLEAAFETLSEARRLEDAAETSQARVRRLERSSRDLDEALARLDLARDRAARGPAPAYPEDFLERARALEEGLWPRRTSLEAELEHLRRPVAPPMVGPERLVAPIGAGFLVVGTLFWVFGAGTIAAAMQVVGLLCLAVWVGRRRTEVMRARERHERRQVVEADLEQVRDSVADLLEGIPEAATLTSETLPARRAEFAREAADRELAEATERALRTAMDNALRELTELDREASRAVESELGGDQTGHPLETMAGGLTGRTRDLLRRLHDAAGLERDETLAPLRVRLGDIGRVRFDLPEGVEPTVDGVRAARRRCLDRSERARAELMTIEGELAVEARPDASAIFLERELEDVRRKLVDRRARARAYRHACRLVGDAYESFRRTDEERLLTAVSAHLAAVSDGVLGPLEVGEGLEDAKVLLDGRAVPIDTPPLSYGQLHTALLSIRMGATDFLAGLGVQLPLLIDDPFVHLDEHSAAELWRILQRVSRDRQVILATQDRLVLQHLGVEPDISLGATRTDAAPVNRLRASATKSDTDSNGARGEGAATNGRSAEQGADEAPDLWSQLDG